MGTSNSLVTTIITNNNYIVEFHTHTQTRSKLFVKNWVNLSMNIYEIYNECALVQVNRTVVNKTNWCIFNA